MNVKDMADDHFSENLVVNRLRHLRNYAPKLITTQQSFEETMAELNDLLQQPDDEQLLHLRGQILLATNTVLFAYDAQHMDDRDSLNAWILTHVHRIWEFTRRTSVPVNCDNRLLRESVVECLIDIEEALPGLLLCKLDELMSSIHFENCFTFQSYVSLSSLVLRNASSVNKFNIERTNELLVLMGEVPLKEDPHSNLSGRNLDKCLVQLMDISPMLSKCSARYVVSNVAHVVRALQLNPSIFKTFVHSNMFTYDLGVVDVILQLKELFGERVFSKEEIDTLHTQTMVKSTLPHYESTIASQCILLEWSKQHLQSVDAVVDLELFVPSPWDTPDVEEKKIELLTLLAGNKERTRVTYDLLMKCLDCLSSNLHHDVSGRKIATLYKLIYALCVNRSDAFVDALTMETDISKILLNVLSERPHFSEHTVALLRRMERDKTLGNFVRSIMSSAIQSLVSMQLSELTADQLANHMLFFAEVTSRMETTADETSLIMEFISSIMDHGVSTFDADSDSSIWFLGYQILNVCKHLLCHHNTNINFSEIGEVLHKISTSYSDLDVRDRAEFYYMLLTTLSPRKITALLRFQPQNQPGNCNFVQLMNGETTYTYPQPVLAIAAMIFDLKRVPMDYDIYEDSEEPVHINDGISYYLHWLENSNIFWTANFAFQLSIVQHVRPEYDVLYAIVLTFSSTNSELKAQDVEVLKLSQDQGFVPLAVTVIPSRVVCTSLHVSAVFNTRRCLTCSTNLAPIVLGFQDLLQPLPVPSDHSKHPNAWRRFLAEMLWSEFSCQKSNNQFLSVMRVIATRETYERLVSVTLKPFVTDMFLHNDVDMKCTVAIFLPKCSHLIMRMKYADQESGFYVHFATDDKTILPQVNIFLQNLEEQSDR